MKNQKGKSEKLEKRTSMLPKEKNNNNNNKNI